MMLNLSATKIGTKNYVSLNTKTTEEAKDISKPQTLLELNEKISRKIQEKLKNINDEICRTLDKELAVPAELLVLLNLLMVGNSSDKTGFTVHVKKNSTDHFVQPQKWKQKQFNH